MLRNAVLILLLCVLVLAACSEDEGGDVAVIPTATLIPPPGQVPDPTATPFITRTPLPSDTPTRTPSPLPSETPIPSNTPTPVPIIGIVSSIQRVNIRTGPDVDFPARWALDPGTGVEVLQTNDDETWYNIEWEDEADGLLQGWVFGDLLFIQDPPTAVPTFTLTPDLTALALGTGTPIGGGQITATPPRAAVSATPVGTEAQLAQAITETPTRTNRGIPTIEIDSINLTATELASDSEPLPSPPPALTDESPNAIGTPTAVIATIRAPGTDEDDDEQTTATPSPTRRTGPAQVQEGADVFAMCDNPTFGFPPPDDLAAGSTAEVFWAWYMRSPEYEQEHVNAVNYEIRINGRLLNNWRQYGLRTQQVGDSYAKYWYVPVGELEAGDYTVTYRATWSEPINDGWDSFGPGTNNPVEEGTCTFTVS
jgi:hypothetical protein